MVAHEYAMNLTPQSMSDNQLDDGGKIHMAHL